MTPTRKTLDPETLRELQALLRQARDRLVRTAERTTEELATLEGREPGALTEDASRVDTLSTLDRLSDRERHEVEEIDAAAARIIDGTFGTCERCGGSIPLPRLRAVPAARRCLACQTSQE